MTIILKLLPQLIGAATFSKKTVNGIFNEVRLLIEICTRKCRVLKSFAILAFLIKTELCLLPAACAVKMHPSTLSKLNETLVEQPRS